MGKPSKGLKTLNAFHSSPQRQDKLTKALKEAGATYDKQSHTVSLGNLTHTFNIAQTSAEYSVFNAPLSLKNIVTKAEAILEGNIPG